MELHLGQPQPTAHDVRPPCIDATHVVNRQHPSAPAKALRRWDVHLPADELSGRR
jgi:hypothetical protein